MVRSSQCLGFIALGHTLIMLLFFSSHLLAMVQAGWFNSVQGDVHRAADFFSLYFGFAMGVASLALLRSPMGPWALALLGLTGALAMPIGGFWLALPAAWIWRGEASQCA